MEPVKKMQSNINHSVLKVAIVRTETIKVVTYHKHKSLYSRNNYFIVYLNVS